MDEEEPRHVAAVAAALCVAACGVDVDCAAAPPALAAAIMAAAVAMCTDTHYQLFPEPLAAALAAAAAAAVDISGEWGCDPRRDWQTGCYAAGQLVEIQGIKKRAELNGLQGEVLSVGLTKAGRHCMVVDLGEHGQPKMLPANCAAVVQARAGEEDTAADIADDKDWDVAASVQRSASKSSDRRVRIVEPHPGPDFAGCVGSGLYDKLAGNNDTRVVHSCECRFLCPPYESLERGVCMLSDQCLYFALPDATLRHIVDVRKDVLGMTVYNETGFIRVDSDGGECFFRPSTQAAADSFRDVVVAQGGAVGTADSIDDLASEKALLSAVCRSLGLVEESDQAAEEARNAFLHSPRRRRIPEQEGARFKRTSAERAAAEEKAAVERESLRSFGSCVRLAYQYRREGDNDAALLLMRGALVKASDNGVPDDHPSVAEVVADMAWMMYEGGRRAAATHLLLKSQLHAEVAQMSDWRHRVARLLSRAEELRVATAAHGPAASARDALTTATDGGCMVVAERQRLACLEQVVKELSAVLSLPVLTGDDHFLRTTIALKEHCESQLPILKASTARLSRQSAVPPEAVYAPVVDADERQSAPVGSSPAVSGSDPTAQVAPERGPALTGSSASAALAEAVQRMRNVSQPRQTAPADVLRPRLRLRPPHADVA